MKRYKRALPDTETLRVMHRECDNRPTFDKRADQTIGQLKSVY